MATTYSSIFTNNSVKTYTDLDFSLMPNPFNGDLRKKSDEDAIKQSFKNLLFIRKGEKPFDPTFGGNVYDLLFEQLDDILTLQLKQAIVSTITTKEPRVILLDVILNVDESSSQLLDISITYSMKNVFAPTTVNYLINRYR